MMTMNLIKIINVKNKEDEIYLLLDNSIEESDQSQKIRRREAASGGKTPPPLKDNDKMSKRHILGRKIKQIIDKI